MRETLVRVSLIHSLSLSLYIYIIHCDPPGGDTLLAQGIYLTDSVYIYIYIYIYIYRDLLN